MDGFEAVAAAFVFAVIIGLFGLMGYAIHEDGNNYRQCIAAGKSMVDGDCK